MTHLDGVVCIVAGANSGVGKSATILLAERGATVHMICRDPRKGEAALGRLGVVWPLTVSGGRGAV